MRKCMALVALLLALSLLLSCAPQATPQVSSPQSPAPAAPSAVSPKLSLADEKSREWERVLEAAKKEGVVVLISTAGSEARLALMLPFMQRYGIRMEFLTAKGAEVSQKLQAERRAGLYMADVYNGGSNTPIDSLKPAKVLDPLEPALLLPELTGPELIKKVWFEGRLWWLDSERQILAMTVSPSGRIAINTSSVKPGEIKSWRDLLNPKWKGKMTMNDPTTAGVGQKTFAALSKIVGVDYLRELAKQEPVIIRDQRLQVEWLAHGKYPIAMAPKSDPITELTKAGAPLAIITPEEGMFLAVGSGNVALVNRAPHPNAAKVLINWLLSAEGQALWVSSQRTHSLRLDVPIDNVEPDRLREPGVKYFFADTEEFLLETPKQIALAKEIYGHLLK